MFTLARYCTAHGLEQEGLDLQKEALAICKSQFGSDNPTTRQIMRDLAFTCWKLNRMDESKSFLKQALQDQRWESGCEFGTK